MESCSSRPLTEVRRSASTTQGPCISQSGGATARRGAWRGAPVSRHACRGSADDRSKSHYENTWAFTGGGVQPGQLLGDEKIAAILKVLPPLRALCFTQSHSPNLDGECFGLHTIPSSPPLAALSN